VATPQGTTVDRWVWHRPCVYSYRTPRDLVRVRVMWNRYPGHRSIGVAVVVWRRAYCLKWAMLAGRR
jgi:hypothetical protein